MIQIVQIGVGPLGQKVVRYALQREGVKIVAAVDPDPRKAGRDLGEICGEAPLGINIQKTLAEALSDVSPDAAVVTTLSNLKTVAVQIEELAAAGLPVVSTCEELSYPWETQPERAEHLDEICKKYGVACLGTGVNPGFLMDYLPAVFTSVCQNVDSVVVTRIQDASRRRIPFQQKIGAGLTPEQFEVKEKEGLLRHVGLAESIYMIGAALNWKLERVEESLKPVVAEEPVSSGYKPIENGNPVGVEQVGRGFVGGRERITLNFRAAVGEGESYDKVEIRGTPSFSSVITGGINGDIATSAITVNSLASIIRTEPGLKTMLEIPVPACFKEI